MGGGGMNKVGVTPTTASKTSVDQEDPQGALLNLSHAQKSFGAVKALIDGSIELYPGEAHALVGENGAGKSTMVKTLAGIYQPDSGTIKLRGKDVTIAGPRSAIANGIAIIYQEPTLFPDLSVAENMYFGRQPKRSLSRIDKAELNSSTTRIFRELGVQIDPKRPARGLSIAEQQLVEIAKALSLNASIIVMDEPTAALSIFEVERLFGIIRNLKAQGKAIMFISHRLEEIYEICERTTVMRDGSFIFTSELSKVTPGDLITAMVGRALEARPALHGRDNGNQVLSVEHLSRQGSFYDISFTINAGEIVALSGLVGAGRSEVATSIFGIRKYDTGQVKILNRRLKAGSPSLAMANGIGLVPEDRRQQGLIMDSSIESNIALGSLASLSNHGLITQKKERSFATDWALRLQLKFSKLSNNVSTLSGGNQQKVVLARWMGRNPKLLIIDEPTRGIDVATKAAVHKLLFELAQNGVAILVISSELPEVLLLADRILVMREGRLVGEFTSETATEALLVAASTTQAKDIG